eukprot:s5158_g2.t1
MREQLRALTKEPMRDLARKLGIRVNPLNKPKGLDVLMDEVMQLLAGSAASSGPQRSTQQSSQQLREEEIFKQDNRMKEELENKTKDGLLALGTMVLHARGEDWMPELQAQIW